MKKKNLILLSLLFLLTGCSFLQINNNDDPNSGNNPPIVNPDKKHPEDEIASSMMNNEELYNQFFTYGNEITVELTFTNKVILKLAEYGITYGNNDNYDRNEMYHPCTAKITINNQTSTYYEVGARLRGNMSRVTDFLFDTGAFIEGKNFHFKLSFNKTFDDSTQNDYYITSWSNNNARTKRKDRTFGGMKKIDFKWNRNLDNTFTKELYALDAFKEEGILAQRSNLVKVIFKNDTGVQRELIYQAQEAVDKQLVKKRLPTDYKGDLYKCLYLNSKADLTNTNNLGIERKGFRPTYSLKTNEETSDFSVFKTFIQNVNKTGSEISGEEYYNNISNYMDVDNFLKYSALCWVFGLPDDLRNNCNNYYLYFNKDNKALFLPYDNDRCLGIRHDWNIDLKSKAYDHKDDSNGQWNNCPLIHRFLDAGSNNSNRVHQDSMDQFYNYCLSYANKYLDVNKFQEFTNLFEGIAPSTDISNGGTDNDSFAIYASYKLATFH